MCGMTQAWGSLRRSSLRSTRGSIVTPCSQASSFVYGEQEHQLPLQLLLPPQHQVTGCSRHMKQGILSWLGLLAPTAGMLGFVWQEARACSCSQLP